MIIPSRTILVYDYRVNFFCDPVLNFLVSRKELNGPIKCDSHRVMASKIEHKDVAINLFSVNPLRPVPSASSF